MATTTIDLADAIDALTGIEDAALTEHHGTLHVYLPSVAAYGAFAAALAARLTGNTRFTRLRLTPDQVPAIFAAARTTWDDRLAEKGWMDGGVLGAWFPGVTVTQARVSPADLARSYLIDAATGVHWDDTGWTECRACLWASRGNTDPRRTGRVLTGPVECHPCAEHTRAAR
jgi:hypothetical protein